MHYQPLYELLPDLAERETRILTTINHPELPADEYALVESYCNEPGCDCRRVFLNVGSLQRQKIEAVITYGWESKKFYIKWFGDNDPKIIKELKGPALNVGSPQSELAPALLREVTRLVLQDKNYVNRLKKHYHMFKDVVDAVASEDSEAEEEMIMEDTTPRLRIGRNDPCLCGSGKKYKKCCGKN